MMKIIRKPLPDGRNKMYFDCFYHGGGCVQKDEYCPLKIDCKTEITYEKEGYPKNKIVRCSNYLCKAM